MINILFVEANTSILYQKLAIDYSAIEPPTWSLLLAESCRKKGHKVGILDCNAERLNVDESISKIEQFNAEIVCFVVYGQNPNSGTTNMAASTILAKKYKAEFPNSFIMFIGSHTSAMPREVLKNNFVDFVSINEGVFTLHDLLNTNKKDHLDKVRGLGYKKDDIMRFGAPAEIVPQDQLDIELPGYAWDLLPFKNKPLDLYRSHFWHANYNHKIRTPFAAIYTSLGCRFQCSFCMINIVNRTSYLENSNAGDSSGMRHWGLNTISKEIKKLSDYGVKNIRLSDEMFFLNKKYYEPILDNLTQYDGELNLWSYSRVDTINQKLLKKIKRAGFNWIGMGIESGNQTVRQEISKGSFKVIDINDVLDEVRSEGISIGANYIFGFPDDNYETVNETLDLAKKINAEFSNVYPCMALPGSPIHNEAIDKGWDLPSEYPEYGFLSYECKPLPTKYMTNKEVIKFRDEAWHELNTDSRFLDMIVSKFGNEAKQNIIKQTKIRLKRRLLDHS